MLDVATGIRSDAFLAQVTCHQAWSFKIYRHRLSIRVDRFGTMQRRVLFLSRDHASVQAIAPVAAELSRHPGIDPVAMSFDSGDSTYGRFGLRAIPVDETRFFADREGFIHELLLSVRPHLIISGSSVPTASPPETPEQFLSRAAHARGIPTMCVLDTWNYYRERFAIGSDTSREQWLLPSTICALDRVCFEDLRLLGVPANRIEITHNPWLDEVARASMQKLRDLDVPPGENMFSVLFASQPLAQTRHRRNWPYTQYDLFDMLWVAMNRVHGARPKQVIVWLHPKESRDEWRTRGRSDGDVSMVISEERGSPVLKGVDVLVTSHSTVAHEALYFHTPCIMLRPDKPPLEQSLPDRLGLTTIVSSADDLVRQLEAPTGALRLRLAGRKRELLAEGTFFSNGGATARVSAVALKHLDL
jgi:hypothetical protein